MLSQQNMKEKKLEQKNNCYWKIIDQQGFKKTEKRELTD